MIGAIVGDIVGSRFEFDFRNCKSKNFELFHKDCSFTDDTVLTIAVGMALVSCKGDYSKLSEIAEEFIRAMALKYEHAGFGGMFTDWMYREIEGPYNSFGNGAAMRVSPVAYFANSIDEVEQLSYAVTSITHNHPEGIKGAEAVAVATYLALHDKSKEEIKDYICKNYYLIDFTLDEIRPTYKMYETCQMSVPQALEAFFESTSFEDSIRNAISIGGDSDTIGAITGSIAGAYYGVFMGYKKGKDGKPEIIESDAKVIRYIYNQFLKGYTVSWIANDLTKKKIKTPGKKEVWQYSTVISILRNEKYSGDAILQKTYKPDLLSHQKKNNGQVQKYFVENSHPAIVSKEVYKEAQLLLAEQPRPSGPTYDSVFQGKIICGDCGSIYGHKTWHTEDERFKSTGWECNKKHKNTKICLTPRLRDPEIKEAFLKALNKIITNKESVIQDLREIETLLCNTDELVKEKETLEAEKMIASKMLDKHIGADPITAEDITKYGLDELESKLISLQEKINNLEHEILKKDCKRNRIKLFIKDLNEKTSLVSDFNDDDFSRLVDHMTVYTKKRITVTFRGGYEL